MGTTAITLLTFEQFEQLPDQPGKCELLEGDLIELPPAYLEHCELAIRIYHLLLDGLTAAQARGEAAALGRVYIEMGYRLGGRSYVQPDVSVTHRDQARGKYLEGAPAIAIEVISPSNTAEAMEKKAGLYFCYGALEVWRVYRNPLHVVIHLADSSRTIWDGAVTTPLLPGFELRLPDLGV